jgi:purine-binding chemotaxis protein CheW
MTAGGAAQSFVTMRVAGQLFGASVMMVQDVLRAQMIASIPLAPREIAGSLNLRGRIVTVIDLRARLGLPPVEDPKSVMHAVVEHHEELCSLMVDSVGDVLNLPLAQIEKAPANLEPLWKEIAAGVHRLENELLILLDIQSILTFKS